MHRLWTGKKRHLYLFRRASSPELSFKGCSVHIYRALSTMTLILQYFPRKQQYIQALGRLNFSCDHSLLRPAERLLQLPEPKAENNASVPVLPVASVRPHLLSLSLVLLPAGSWQLPLYFQSGHWWVDDWCCWLVMLMTAVVHVCCPVPAAVAASS